MKAYVVILIALISFVVLAAEVTMPVLTKAEKAQVIDSLSTSMKNLYVFPDIGEKVAKLLEENSKNGAYNSITDPFLLSQQLTTDLRSVNGDKHLALQYAPEQIAQNKGVAANDETAKKQQALDLARDNYGFKEIKILPGNIGYIKFNEFAGNQEAFKTAIGAMAFLANSDAIIFDLTENGGGDPAMIQLITSYLYPEGETQHLNSFFLRETGVTTQAWTLPFVPGKCNPNAEVYVLTSSFTFSGAEEFAYNLKNLKRATIIGEITGGGAHPVNFYPINDIFIAKIPFGRAVNPITKTNWEGTGVEPNVTVPSSKAFDTAYKLALGKLVTKTKDETYKSKISWFLKMKEIEDNPSKPSTSQQKMFTGIYGPRAITLEKGELFYQRQPAPKLKMIPISETIFKFNEVPYFMLEVVVKDGKAVKLIGHYNDNDGRTDESEITK